jgi:hypothetical protein
MCALGHCGYALQDSVEKQTKEGISLINIFSNEVGANVTTFNDGVHFYLYDMRITDLGSSAKERMINILALLASGVWKDFRESLDVEYV